MNALELHGLHKRFDGFHAIRGVDLKVEKGEFVVFVGPSGCGKSTLLRMIAGLEIVTEGEIFLHGDRITERPAAKRGLAMVFQSYALYPHMSVAENMSFALKLAGVDRATIDRKVHEAAAVLQLEPLLERKPKALSGGQRQRVAIGRAIVREPRAFLFDEPLSNLDAALRVQMRQELAALHQRLGATMIYVTHDQVEAMTLADKVVILNGGVIEQCGAPLEVYDNPAGRFVAEFIGTPKMNFIALTDDVTGALSADAGERSLDERNLRSGDRLGVRPEAVSLGAGPLSGTVCLTEHLGAETLVYLDFQGERIAARAQPHERFQPGASIPFALDLGKAHAFATDGRRVSAAISG